MTRLDDQREDVFVEIIDMDTTAEEMVTENADGSYTIFINARIAFNRQQEAVEHAIRHIKDQDFEKTDVQQIEAVAHQIAPEPQEPKKKTRQELDFEKWERRQLRLARRYQRQKKAKEKEMEELRKRVETLDYLRSLDPDMFERDFVGWI